MISIFLALHFGSCYHERYLNSRFGLLQTPPPFGILFKQVLVAIQTIAKDKFYKGKTNASLNEKVSEVKLFPLL